MRLILFLTLMIPFFGCNADKELETSGPPNILFVMTDDHAFQAISAYGSNLIETPNIDRLAQEGMLFERAFVTNSICAPSRATILTGQFSHRNGLVDNGVVFDSTQMTFPRLLQAAGYQTAIVGKWHLKTQPMGFDFWRVLRGQGKYYHPELRDPDTTKQYRGYTTYVITDLTLEWLKEGRDPNQPFLMLYQHKAPHREWRPAIRDLKSMVAGKTYPEPSTLFDDYSGRGRASQEAEMRIADHMSITSDNKISVRIADSLGIERFLPWYDRAYGEQRKRYTAEELAAWEDVYAPMNKAFAENPPQGDDLIRFKYQRYMQDYLGSIKAVDDNLGRVLAYLDSAGIADNTIVVYTSDQGFYLGEHGWFDKRFMYEPSFRTPLIVRWPGQIKAGVRNQKLVQNLDFAQTFLDVAGLEAPDSMQGKSLVPLLKQEETDWRDAIYYHYYEYPGIHAVKRHYGVRTDRYKLIHFYHDIDEWELFDLEKDPDELKNLYADPAYADIRDNLHERLLELQNQYGDSNELAQQMIPQKSR
ncbi:MAG: sulfatase [Saprospiraceae bacterium]|nr:sulfatase [Saprospiraceae bacterium]